MWEIEENKSENEGAMSEREPALPLTMAVPKYGKLTFNLSEASAYAAADRGDIPTIEIGGLRKVPVRMGLSKLAGGDSEVLKAVTADFAAKFHQLKAGEAA
jgi:hypothetical protein